MIKFVYDDGGRAKAGFKGITSDCVTRSIAITTGLPYRQVYDDMNALCKDMGYNVVSGSRTGHYRKVYQKYLADNGYQWTPLSRIGAPSIIRVNQSHLPAQGAYILRLSRHVTAWVDGELRDNHDCSRGGNRMVYGYFTIRR